MTLKIAIPPERLNPEGETRRVGVEIEFAGLSVPAVSRLVHNQFGGKLCEKSPHRHLIEDTRFGTFTVELDAQVVHGPEETGAGDNSALKMEKTVRQAIGESVSGLVPTEIVAPPIHWDELDCLSGLFDRLRKSGAEGTEDSPLNSFGLHLNPELALHDAGYIASQFKAFLALSDWLRETLEVDLTRRLMPHIEPFPKTYAAKVLQPGYKPDLATFIDDYIAANPTRNRELDLLPLFRFLDEDRVVTQMNADLVKARPTFHYRLPNCSISDPNWNVVVEWNRWVKVEALAAEPDRLEKACAACLQSRSEPAPLRWWNEFEEWLSE